MQNWWRAFRSSGSAAAVVVAIAGLAAVATSPPSSTVDAQEVKGVFLLTQTHPSATITFDASANEIASQDSSLVTLLDATFSTLDPDATTTATVSLDDDPIATWDRYSGVTHSCRRDCFSGQHTIRFELMEQTDRVLVSWSLKASARFDTIDAPEGAAVELAVRTDGNEAPFTGFMSDRPSLREWLDNTLEVRTQAAMDDGSEVWLAYPSLGQTALMTSAGVSVPVQGGGAMSVPIPDECFLGPCNIEARVVASPTGGWSFFLIGSEDLPHERSNTSNVEVPGTSGLVKYQSILPPGASEDLELYVRLSDVDADVVAVVEPTIRILLDDRTRDQYDKRVAYQIGEDEVGHVGYEAMDCDGSVCEATVTIRLANLLDEEQTVLTGLEVFVYYGESLPLHLELRP